MPTGILAAKELLEHRIYAWANHQLDKGGGQLKNFAFRSLRDLFKWTSDHPFWSVFVVLLLYCCGIVVWASLSASRKRHQRQVTPRQLGEIVLPNPRDPFHPRSGWRLVDTDDTAHPTLPKFSRPKDVRGGLQIGKVKAPFAIERTVDPPGTLCEELQYKAKYTSAGVVYAYVRVISRDRANTRGVYLAYTFGRQPPSPYADGNDEWRIESIGTPLDNEWRMFSHSLRDDVLRTFGSLMEGWSYVGLIAVRIRNALSISPIELYASNEAIEPTTSLPGGADGMGARTMPAHIVAKWRKMVTEVHNQTQHLGESEAVAFLARHPDFPSIRKHLSESTLAICNGAIDAAPRNLGSPMHSILRYVLDDIDNLEG